MIFMGEFKTCKFMFKKIVIFFQVFICIIILSGCEKADSNVTYNYGSSDSLTVYKELDKEFYMFRAGNKYYEFRRIDGYLTIEDMYGITVDRIDDVVCLHLDKTVSKPGSSLWTYLEDWYSMKNKLGHGRITREEYDEWRYNFPHSGTSEQTAVPPSQQLSDALVEAMDKSDLS